jgi:hypothetical protein
MSGTCRWAFTLCFACTALLAQSSVNEIPFVPLEADCPIGIRATLEKSGNLLGAQRLEIILGKWPAFGVIASRITVHGIAPVANHPEPSEITESLELNRIVDHPRPPISSTVNVAHASTENDMPWLLALGEPVIVRRRSPDSRWYAWVMGFIAVNSIDLDSVSFADGTTWHVADGKTCRVSVSSSDW